MPLLNAATCDNSTQNIPFCNKWNEQKKSSIKDASTKSAAQVNSLSDTARLPTHPFQFPSGGAPAGLTTNRERERTHSELAASELREFTEERRLLFDNSRDSEANYNQQPTNNNQHVAFAVTDAGVSEEQSCNPLENSGQSNRDFAVHVPPTPDRFAPNGKQLQRCGSLKRVISIFILVLTVFGMIFIRCFFVGHDSSNALGVNSHYANATKSDPGNFEAGWSMGSVAPSTTVTDGNEVIPFTGKLAESAQVTPADKKLFHAELSHKSRLGARGRQTPG